MEKGGSSGFGFPVPVKDHFKYRSSLWTGDPGNPEEF
jgi:hypothetical protein